MLTLSCQCSSFCRFGLSLSLRLGKPNLSSNTHVVQWTLVYIPTITKFFIVIFDRFLCGFSLSQYTFFVARYDTFYITHTAVAGLDCVSVEDFMERCCFGEMFVS